MGIREERKAATLKQIQSAALELVELHGLDKVTISQIAERAGIADRTFFRYCQSKEAAILPRQQDLIEAMLGCEYGEAARGPQIFAALSAACREIFVREIGGSDFRRISRLMISEPKLVHVATAQEQELVAVIRDDLAGRGLLDYMSALLVGELVATTWRVAWQCFAQEEQAGNPCSPVELYDRAVASLARLAQPLSE